MRPLGVRSQSVKFNNICLVRHLLERGSFSQTVQPILTNLIAQADDESEDMASKVRYLWQDTLEALAQADQIDFTDLTNAWKVVATPSKPTVPEEFLKLYRYEPDVPPSVVEPSEALVTGDPHLDQFLRDDPSPDSNEPVDPPKVMDDLDLTHDTFDDFSAVFNSWPYILVRPHKLYGNILVLGQLSGRNKNQHMVYRGCKFNGDSFSKIGAIEEFSRKGTDGATHKIKILKARDGLVKFWVNVDDPTRPKGSRDLPAYYRYFLVTNAVLAELDSLAYQASKNVFEEATT